MPLRAPVLLVSTVVIGLICASTAMLTGSDGGQSQARVSPFRFVESVSRLTDVQRLEEFASKTNEQLAGEIAINGMVEVGEMLRITAYARLGELGTPESLDAVRRIEAAARQWATAPATISRARSPHPAWHMSTGPFRAIAEATGENGVHYAIILASYFGPWNAFLVSDHAPADGQSWTRPKLIPRPIFPGVTEPRLVSQAADRLVLTFTQVAPQRRSIMEGSLKPGPATPSFGPQRWEISIADVERDSDGDGWTDQEEARLGLDAHHADSDGDGLPDGRDPAPAYRAPASDAGNDRITVLQRAFFAAFGLTHARYLLFVRSGSAHFQPWGYRGPLLFDRDIPDPKTLTMFDGVYVNWEITKMTDTEAEVTLADYEGPLAAGGQEVLLRKVGSDWYVVKRRTTWIS